MFQSLRAGSSIYILHKNGTPVLEMGSIVSVTAPMPKYTVPPVFGQPQEMVVDMVVKVNGQDLNYQKVPANSDIADFGMNGVVISDSRDAMNAEIVNLKNKSAEIISSVDFHKGVIENCNKILENLNPEFAERQAQQNDINSLKAQMQELMELNKSLLERLGCDSASKE
ncbi:MAG: hypothetical protein MJZ12_00330 [Prevotella sp.]|nr:hypothetical protein [Prevotella sp.]